MVPASRSVLTRPAADREETRSSDPMPYEEIAGYAVLCTDQWVSLPRQHALHAFEPGIHNSQYRERHSQTARTV
jgi:hypothetical protein